MPRGKKTSDDETELKSVRRTRQTSVVTDSPVRRSARNKHTVESSPDFVKENTSNSRRVRKQTPTSDADVSSQPTRTLRKRNLRSESEAPPTPQRVTRRTRASSVTETTIISSKKSTTTSSKGRRRLVSVPVELSYTEEEKDESLKKSEEKQTSSHENLDKVDDHFQEVTTSLKEKENEESLVALVETEPMEDSIVIVDELTGVKSAVKKKEKYFALEKRLVSRLMLDRLNDSNNDSIAELKDSNILKSKAKKDQFSGEKVFTNSYSENVETEENFEEKLEKDSSIETSKEKSPRGNKEREAIVENSSGDEDESMVKSFEERKKEIPKKQLTPYKRQSFSEMGSPNKKEILNKSKTPKKQNPTKRFSIEFPEDKSGDLIEENRNDFFSEPMEVDEIDADLISNNENEIDLENRETIDIPNSMNCNFKPRRSMVEFTSEKHQVFKTRHSLREENIESGTFDLTKEKEKYLKKKGRKSLEKIDSDSVNRESKSLNDILPSERKSPPDKRQSYTLSNLSVNLQSLDTPEKDISSKTKEEMSISLTKSSEKKSRKRKRENSESDSSYQLMMLEYDAESSPEKNDVLDSTLTEENIDEDEAILRNQKSLKKRKSNSLNASEFTKEEEEVVDRTPKSLQKKKNPSEDLEENKISTFEKMITPKDKNKRLSLSESQEKKQIQYSEEDNLKSKIILNSADYNFETSPDVSCKSRKKRSKSNSFEVSEFQSGKPFDENRVENEYRKSVERETSNLQRSSKNEDASESESEERKSEMKQKSKPVITSVENFQENDNNNCKFVQELKSNSEKSPEIIESQTNEKKLSEDRENEEFSEDEISEEEKTIPTVKKFQKRLSFKTTPPLPLKSKFNELNDSENSEKKSKKNVHSKIPTFLFSQSSSESENKEVGSDAETSKSIDSDIAKEYNFDGKSISSYSDDDVPADECRASESEYSNSEDDGSDLADFIVDDDEEEEIEGGGDEEEETQEEREEEGNSDDSVFETGQEKSPEVSEKEIINEETEEENEEKDVPSLKDNKTKNRNSSLKVDTDHKKSASIIRTSDQKRKVDNEQLQEQTEQIQEHKMKKSNLALPSDDLSLRKSFDKKLCAESLKSNVEETELRNGEVEKEKESRKKLKMKITEKEEEPQLSPEKTKKKKSKKTEVDYEVKVREGSLKLDESQKESMKTMKKSKRKLKSKSPVASSTHYEMSDSQEEPESLSFADARNEMIKDTKKKSKSAKAGKEGKKEKKKVHIEEAEVVDSGSIKRLPDELLQDLEDVPRPKKRQKITKVENLETPSLGMHDRRYEHSSKKKCFVSASSFGSTTDFEVLSLQKERKAKVQASLALKWFKQRMLARNNRQPISVYLSQQQKRRAAGKHHF